MSETGTVRDAAPWNGDGTETGEAPGARLRRSHARGPVRRVLRAGVVGAGVGLVALIGGFFLFLSAVSRYDSQSPPQADGIVALTGGSQRIADAIELLARGHGQRLLISGVNERTGRAELARLNPGQKRLLDCCVDLDYRARNTAGNAVETRRWVLERGFSSILVVTSNYHMPRTMVELERALPEIRRTPHAVVPSGMDLSAWWRDQDALALLGIEYAKFVAAWTRARAEAILAHARTSASDHAPAALAEQDRNRVLLGGDPL